MERWRFTTRALLSQWSTAIAGGGDTSGRAVAKEARAAGGDELDGDRARPEGGERLPEEAARPARPPSGELHSAAEWALETRRAGPT